MSLIPSSEQLRYDEVSLVFSKTLSFDEWEGLGGLLGQINRCSGWWIGDWVNYGEARYGEKYSQALEVTGLAYQTLQNYAWVARAIPRKQRRRELSFNHHLLVATDSLSEDERVQWLDHAASGGWSSAEMKRELVSAGKTARKSARWSEEQLCPTCNRLVRERCDE